RSDPCARGMVAFQRLAGSVPFHGDTLAGVMHHHFFTPVPDLGLVRDDVPGTLNDLVRRALHKDPERRFETTREMLTAIEATPFSERDRLDSERILQHLVQGRDVPKIATRALPPLADMPTLAMDARPPGSPPTRPRPRISAGRLAGLAGGGLVALGPIWLLGRPSPVPAPAGRASLPPAAGPPGGPPRGAPDRPAAPPDDPSQCRDRGRRPEGRDR